MSFIQDVLTRLTTCPSPYLRHMGYLNEAIGMRGRAHARRASWQPHLDNTRRFVLSSADKCRNRNTALVLGSGLLLDLPLAQLSSLFREVVLADVVCLPEARREIRKYANVTFLEHDATGLAERLYLNRHRGVRELPEPETPSLAVKADFVVSLNILSQLWVIPRAFILREFPGYDEQALNAWCSEISAAHRRMLMQTPAALCLVADHAFVTHDATGAVIDRGSTVGNLSLPKPDESWTWLIDPQGKGGQVASKELLVGAWFWNNEGAEKLP